MLAMILGPDGIVVIVVVAIVLLFGGAKLPALARGLGSAAHEFKKGTAEGDSSAAELSKSRAALESDLKRTVDALEHPQVTSPLVRSPEDESLP